MTFRKFVSLSIAFGFVFLSISGILSYFFDYSRPLATVHTVFGLLFTFGVIFHLSNNWKPLHNYSRSKITLLILMMIISLFIAALFQFSPLQSFMDFGASQKANSKKSMNLSEYEVLTMNSNKDILISIDLLRSEHYWHPQIAVWVEDTLGNYIESIYVSKTTAKGLFFGGRTKNNFKEFDVKKDGDGEFRRVNALPVWSHKRGIIDEDGWYVPSNKNPLPDAISGATFADNFRLISSIDGIDKFKLLIEINVAFDDNEYFSEYDFPDDEIFHNGTGQLGQPSIIYESEIDVNDGNDYYLMKLIGHGHHSGQTGEILTDLSRLTTAKQIVERIVVGIEQRHFEQVKAEI